ncbi:hypothetical protein [Microbispora siamensis]|nr:hypothetical protein [Microbispora siamensis]
MTDAYLELGSAPEYVVFRTRLGLAVVDLVGSMERPEASRAATRLVSEAVAAGDGYVARDVLAHKGCRTMLTRSEECALNSAVQSSGLARATIPKHLLADLLTSVEASVTR